MWRCVVRWVVPDVSKDHIAFIFRVTASHLRRDECSGYDHQDYCWMLHHVVRYKYQGEIRYVFCEAGCGHLNIIWWTVGSKRLICDTSTFSSDGKYLFCKQSCPVKMCSMVYGTNKLVSVRQCFVFVANRLPEMCWVCMWTSLAVINSTSFL